MRDVARARFHGWVWSWSRGRCCAPVSTDHLLRPAGLTQSFLHVFEVIYPEPRWPMTRTVIITRRCNFHERVALRLPAKLSQRCQQEPVVWTMNSILELFFLGFILLMLAIVRIRELSVRLVFLAI